MLVDMIKNIRAAEENAEDARKKSLAESRKIVQEAELKAAQAFQQSVAAAEAEGRELVAAAEKEGQVLVAPIQQRAAQEIEAIVGAARGKQEAAITMVMERIVKTYGHS